MGFFHVNGTQVRIPDWSSSETSQPPPTSPFPAERLWIILVRATLHLTVTKGISFMTYSCCSVEEMKHQHAGPLSGEQLVGVVCVLACTGEKHGKGQGRREVMGLNV